MRQRETTVERIDFHMPMDVVTTHCMPRTICGQMGSMAPRMPRTALRATFQTARNVEAATPVTVRKAPAIRPGSEAKKPPMAVTLGQQWPPRCQPLWRPPIGSLRRRMPPSASPIATRRRQLRQRHSTPMLRHSRPVEGHFRWPPSPVGHDPTRWATLWRFLRCRDTRPP